MKEIQFVSCAVKAEHEITRYLHSNNDNFHGNIWAYVIKFPGEY